MNIYLLRHGAPVYKRERIAQVREEQRKFLSSFGEYQIKKLAEILKKYLSHVKSEDIVIFSSSQRIARQSTIRLQNELKLQIETNIYFFDWLWKDLQTQEDYLKKLEICLNTLQDEIEKTRHKHIIIVADLSIVREYPLYLGCPKNDARFGEGVLINPTQNLYEQLYWQNERPNYCENLSTEEKRSNRNFLRKRRANY